MSEQEDLGALQPFLDADFDVTAFTKQSLTDPATTEATLGSLRSHLDTVERAISSHVATHEESLLGTLEAVASLKREMTRAKTDSSTLAASLTRVENDFNEPLDRLRTTGQTLRNAHSATGILRLLGWFLVARKKLRSALEERSEVGGKDASRAAQLVAELEELMAHGGLKGVKLVDREAKWVKDMGIKVRQDAQKALEKAIMSLNQGEMGLALQAFFHLNVLEDRVNAAAAWAAKEFAQEARESLKESNLPSGGSDPAQKLQALRNKTDAMLERSLRSWGLRIWNLQRVLTKKRDPTTHVLFSDVVKIHVFDQFWNRAMAALEQEVKTCSRWVREALVGDYARIRRSARSMLGRLWTSTSSVGTTPGSGRKFAVGGPKETKSLMQAFHPLLSDFLVQSLQRLNQPVQVMFPEVEGGNGNGLRHVDPKAKSIPTPNDVNTFAQIISKELLAVKGDIELVGAIAKACGVAISLFCEKSEALISKAESTHQFKVIAPELKFSVSSASAAPISATVRNSVQEHNASILTLLSLLSNKVKDAIDSSQQQLMQELAQQQQQVGGGGGGGEDRDAPTPQPNEDFDPDQHQNDELDDEDELLLQGDEDPRSNHNSRNNTPSNHHGADDTITTTAGAAVSSLEAIPSVIAKLDTAKRELDGLVKDILDEYVGHASLKHTMDDVLAGVNTEDYGEDVPAGESRKSPGYVEKFTKACNTLQEEHLVKLPLNSDPYYHEYLVRNLQLPIFTRFVKRVSMVRPLSATGRETLARDCTNVYHAVVGFTSTINLASSMGTREAIFELESGLQTLQKMLLEGAKEGVLAKLIADHGLNKAVAWHHCFATASKDVQSPHTKAGKTLTQYLNEWDEQTLSEAKIWEIAQNCCVGQEGEELKQRLLQLE